MYQTTRNIDGMKAGTIAPPAYIAEQERRGNLPALLSNGFLVQLQEDKPTAEPLPTLDNLSYRELQRMAKAQDIPANQSRDDLIEALSNGDN